MIFWHSVILSKIQSIIDTVKLKTKTPKMLLHATFIYCVYVQDKRSKKT